MPPTLKLWAATPQIIKYQILSGDSLSNSMELGIKLAKAFTAKVEGWRFTPRGKSGQWNGDWCPINRLTSSFPAGMITSIIDKAQELEWDIDICENIPRYLLSTEETLSQEEAEAFVASLNMSRYNKDTDQFDKFQMYEYQTRMLVESINRRMCVCESATSSGKSASIYAIARWYMANRNVEAAPILILVPTVGLVSQMVSDFTEYSHYEGQAFAASEIMHKVMAGVDKSVDVMTKIFDITTQDGKLHSFRGEEQCAITKTSGKKKNIKMLRASKIIPGDGLQDSIVTAIACREIKPKIWVSTWQSLQDMDQAWFNEMNFGMVIVDEAHGSAATKIQKILNNIKSAEFRLGCTGTLQSEDNPVARMSIQCVLGPSVPIVRTAELIEMGRATPTEVVCCILKYPAHVIKRFNYASKKAGSAPGEKYTNEKQYLLNECNERTELIAKLAIASKTDTLIISDRIELLTNLAETIERQAPDRPLFCIKGQVSPEDRENIRKMIGRGQPAIILGSAQCVSTGLNVPSLGAIIFASPTKSMIRVVQSIGRGIRKRDGKSVCLIFDIIDDLRRITRTGEEKANYLWQHFVDYRLKYFYKEGFPVKFQEIKLKGQFELSGPDDTEVD